MRKLISSLLISAMLLPSAALAAEITVERDIQNSKFHFEGTATAGSHITVNVYGPKQGGAINEASTPQDFQNALNPIDVIKYYNEFYADENGEFNFSVQLSNASGFHKAYVTADGETKSFDLEFVMPDNSNLVAGLIAAPDKKVYIATGNNRVDLGFFLGLYDNADQDKVSALMTEIISRVTDQETAVDVFNEAVIVQALSEGDIAGISAYADKLEILDDNGRYAKRYPLQKAGVDQRLAGKTFATIADFEQALAEAVVLETVKNPNGYLNVQGVMDEFKAELGYTSITTTETVYQQMANQNYADINALKTAYSTLAGGTIVIIPSGGGNNSGKDTDVSTGSSLPWIPQVDPKPIEKNYFNDMGNAQWAKTAVNYLADKGIVSGKAEGEFYPSDTVKREEFVTMIVKAFNLKRLVNLNEFDDVSNDSWFCEYVLAAYQNEIVSGIDDSNFGAGQNITRQDMSVMLKRIADKQGIVLKSVNDAVVFTDDSSIADYAKDAVSALQQAGIVNGMESGAFAPRNSATRAQAAQMIYGLLMAKE